MAYINGATTAATSASAATVVAPAIAATVGNLIVIGVSWVDGSGAITCSVTDSKGNVYTAGTKLRSPGTTASQMFYARVGAGNGGATVVTATFSATSAFRTLLVAQHDNIVSGSAFDAEAAPAAGSGVTPATSAFATTSANDLVVAFFTGLPATAPGSGYYLRHAIDYASMEDRLFSSIQSGIAATATGPNTDWNAHAMAFKTNAAPPPVTIDRTNAAILYSPATWDDDGTAKIANSNGSQLRFGFTGTSLVVSIAALSGLTAYPTFRAYIDNLPPIDITPAAGQTTLGFASGLSTGSHVARIVLKGMPLDGRWDCTAALKVTGLVLDNGASISAVAPRAKWMLAFGDSLSEGERVFSTAAPPAGSDGTRAIWPLVAEALDAELGQLGYGGTGYQAAGVGGVPAFPSHWNVFNSAGRSRLVGGLYAPAPDYIFEMQGTNGVTTQANVAAMISNFRAAAPNAVIFIVVPPGGFAKSAKTAAVAAATGGGDKNVRLLDLSAGEYGAGLSAIGAASAQSPDNLHPYDHTNARLAAKLAALVQHEIEPRRFTVTVA